MQENKKILILSVSVGHGHLRAAQGLEAGLKRWFPQHRAKHVDLMTLVPVLFRKAYKDAYLQLVQANPALWGYFYSRTDAIKKSSPLTKLQQKIESAASRDLLGIIKSFEPDAVICTHFMPMNVLTRWKGKGRVPCLPVWTCVTDFVAHRFWLLPGQSGYFTATEEDAWRMHRRGLENETIRATGIPVLPDFIPPENPRQARRDAAKAFGFDPGKKTFLLMGGGAGVGDMRGMAAELLALPSDFQLVVLTGNNREMLKKLQELAAETPGRLFPLGFTNEVHILLRAADLVITKPGGLTTVECLAMGKPMLVYAPIPGQEEHNADFLLENGAALKAFDSSGLVWKIRTLLADDKRLSGLAANAAALGKPYAARDILSDVLGEAPREP
jgi:processive 1,2-diacylglycerol beta-glucosyltransferase